MSNRTGAGGKRGTGTVAATFLPLPKQPAPRSQSPFFRRPCAVVLVAGGWLFAVALSSTAAEVKTFGPDPQLYKKTVDRAVEFLAAQQGQDGSLSPQVGIGPTALATLGLLQSGRTSKDPQVAKKLAYLEGFAQESGGIHAPKAFIANYETCVAMICFKQANQDGRYDKLIQRAEAFVRGGQWDEGKDKDKSDLSYGGWGYGAKSRPDLSNTSFLLDALKSCGAGADDKAVQKALVFVSRCQNLESEHNTTPFASKVNDGGFYYTCTTDRPDKERGTPEGGLRSYGSMTYAGLKSMIYAGLKKDDPRVKAAYQWIRKHYDVKSNPGMGDAGLYYYYHTFAKALDVLGIDEIEDAQGVKHDWRRELTEELASRQQADGSWVNKDSRWFENDANLVTAYALLALSYCRPQASK